MPGDEALTTAVGLRVTSAVTAKTALLVPADPYTQSGKAKTARKPGIHIVTEQVFLHQLDHMHSTNPAHPDRNIGNPREEQTAAPQS